MQIFADNNMSGLEQTFGRHASVARFDGRAVKPSDLGDADVLLVRSVTRVDASLLRDSKVRFVGTATIGTDHLDTHWLDQNGVTWAAAPGCNADAAAQYTLGMMMLAMQRLDRRLADQQVAIIGHGNVGSRLHRLLSTLDVEVTVCDPPLAEAGLIDSVSFETALKADLVSLHVPLEREGAHPTHHMINSAALDRMRPGALLVNAARGDVVEEAALIETLSSGQVFAALDVWPSEPSLNAALLEATSVATPHVAGYSVEGKQRGTRMIYRAFLEWLGEVETPQTPDDADPNSLDIPWPEAKDTSRDGMLTEAIIQATHVARDDARMRASMPDNAAIFDPLRRAHAPRHEFSYLRLSPPNDAVRDSLKRLGFNA